MRFTRKEREALRNPELAARTRRELADLEHSIDYAEVRGKYAKGQ